MHYRSRILLLLILYVMTISLALAGSLSPVALSVQTYGFQKTGVLVQSRSSHTASLLENGHVLISGGNSTTGALASAEIYNPSTNEWQVAASMSIPRGGHKAVRLSDGRVLVVGGTNTNGYTDSAEIYDPVLNQWVGVAPTGQLVGGFSLTLLLDGTVLMAGGMGSNNVAVRNTQRYNPVTNSWSPSGSMQQGRWGHGAILLANGKLLVIGGDRGLGQVLASTELYDPVTDTWSPASSLAVARNYPAATRLPNGKVFVAGGSSLYGVGGSIASAEIYDPAANTWASAGSLTIPRTVAANAVLGDGRVVVIGGVTSTSGVEPLSSAEMYDPATGRWSLLLPMQVERDQPTATTLLDGSVLVVGCITNDNDVACGVAERTIPVQQVFLPLAVR